MSRRIEVELTSTKPDGTWTWRAAGARQPKGEVDAALLYDGAKVGDVVRADADFDVDGIRITAVLPPKGKRSREPERLEIIGSGRPEELVTTTLAPRGRGDRRRRDDRGDRGDRGDRPRGPRRDGDRRDGDRRRDGGGPRDGRDARSRPRGDGGPGRGERRTRPPRPAPEPRPRAKRLKAGRVHRNEILRALPEVHRPLTEILLRGGIPALRQAVDHQNELLRADGKPVIDPAPLEDLAETLMPAVRNAEWRDKAEAALADADEIDLKDLRSVVVAADTSARDDETRRLADELRAVVAARVDREHASWLAEIATNLDEGRVVRALRLSSRPPKAGMPFPAELGDRLAAATAGSLGADITADRYATVLDALASSPVRTQVVPEHVPDPAPPELVAAVAKLGSRVPQVAAAFGVEPAAPPRSGRPGRGGRGGGGGGRPTPPPAATAPAPAEAPPAPPASAEATPGPEPAPETPGPASEG